MADFFWSTENPDAQEVRCEGGETVQVFPKSVSTIAGEAGNFVWEQDNPAPSGNVFARWDGPTGLYEAMKQVPGQKNVTVNNFFADAEIPAGVWSGITDVAFIPGAGFPVQALILIDDGASLPDCRNLYLNGVIIQYKGTAAPCLPSQGIVVVTLTNDAFVTQTGNFPFVSMGNFGSTGLVTFVDKASAWELETMAASGAASIVAILTGGGQLAKNAAEGSGTLNVLMTPDSVCNAVQNITTFNLQVDGTQVNFANLGGIADGVTDNSATLQAAIDKLAGNGVALVMAAVPGENTYLLASPVKLPVSTSAKVVGFTLIGDPNTTILSTVAPGTVEQAPLVGESTLGVFSTTLAANNVVGSNQFSMTAAPTVGARLLISSGGLGTPFNSAAFFVEAVTGLGPFTVTVDRPILRQFIAAGSSVSDLASWPQELRIVGNGMRITGTGQRWLQLESGLNCEFSALTFDTSQGHPSDAFSISMDVSCQDCTYQDFRVQDSTAVVSNSSLVMESAENCHFVRCIARGSAAPILLLDAMVCDVVDCEGSTGLAAAGFGILLASDGVSYGCQQCTVRGGTYVAHGAGGIGVMLRDGTSDCTVMNVAAPGCAIGYELDAGSGATKNNTFIGCTATSCTTQAMLVAQGVKGTLVQGFDMSRSATLRSNDECVLQGITGQDLPASGGVNLSQGSSLPVCVLDGFLLESTAAGFTGVIANTGNRAIVKNGRVTLNAAPGTTQSCIQLSTAVLELSSVIGDGTNHGGAASFGVHSNAGTTLRLGADVDFSTLDQPFGDVNGYCSKNLGVVAQNNPIVANNAVAVDVTWPDLKASDRVSLTLIAKGGAPSAMPLITYTLATKFTLTSYAGDTSTYGYTIN